MSLWSGVRWFTIDFTNDKVTSDHLIAISCCYFNQVVIKLDTLGQVIYDIVKKPFNMFTYWGLNKMVGKLQMPFSNVFWGIKV